MTRLRPPVWPGSVRGLFSPLWPPPPCSRKRPASALVAPTCRHNKFPTARAFGESLAASRRTNIGWVKYFTHELLDGDGRVKFQIRDTTESLPSASAPKTDKQTGRQGESRNTMMRMSPQPETGEVLAGLVERVTYHNAENGF